MQNMRVSSENKAHIGRWLFALPLILLGGEVVYCFLLRVGYPYGLEWMEGDIMITAHRLANGQPIYTAPQEWISYFYPPLYMILLAPLIKVFGPVLWAGRLLSMLASVGTSYFLFSLARRRTGRSEAGLVAAALFWGFYQYTGCWLDLCRIDSLMLFMAAWGLDFYDRGRTNQRYRIAALFILGSILLAKQNGSCFLLAVGCNEILFPSIGEKQSLLRRSSFLLIGSFISAIWVGVGMWMTGGEYWNFLYSMPANLEGRDMFKTIFLYPTLKYCIPLLLGLLVWMVLLVRRGELSKRGLVLLTLAFAASASIPVTFKYGSFYSNLLPLALGFSLAGGIALGDGLNWSRAKLVWLPRLLLASQVILLLALNRPAQWLPNKTDVEAVRAPIILAENLQRMGDNIWLLSHPYLNLQQDRPVHIKGFAALLYQRCGGEIPANWYHAIEEQQYSAIVSDYKLNPAFDLYDTIIRNYYCAGEILYTDREIFPEKRRGMAPMSGSFTRPTLVWLPRKEPNRRGEPDKRPIPR
jgi:Dolichyl-phosphate-mannose-protein mannosyltransferase